MPIRIQHDAVAAPIVASYAAGVGNAQARASRQQLGVLAQKKMLDERERAQKEMINFRREEAEADRNFQTQRDQWNAQQEWDRAEWQNQQYRDKDELGQLYDAVQGREEFMWKTPLTEEGIRQRDEAVKSLNWIRQNRDQFRPDVYRQYMSQWISEFDSRNPSMWKKEPPNPQQQMAEQGAFFDEAGRPVPYEDIQSGKAGAATMVMPDGRGGYRVSNIGGKAGAGGIPTVPRTSQEFFSDPKNMKDAMAYAKQQITEHNTNAKPGEEWGGDKTKEMMLEYYELQRDLTTAPVQEGGDRMEQPNAVNGITYRQDGVIDMSGVEPAQTQQPQSGQDSANSGQAPRLGDKTPAEWTPTTPDAQALRAKATAPVKPPPKVEEMPPSVQRSVAVLQELQQKYGNAIPANEAANFEMAKKIYQDWRASQ